MTAGIEVTALGNKTTGTSRYITCLIEQLRTSDDNIKIFPSDNFGKQFVKKRGIDKFLYRNFILKKEMYKAKVDYAFFPDYFMPPGLNIPSAIVIHDLSFISHPHLYPKKFVLFYKYQLKETLRNNPLILTISENTRTAIENYLCIKKEKVHLLQAYSDFTGSEKQKNNNYLLYVGHIEPRKNLYFLIKTFLKWKCESGIDMKLVISGEIWIKGKETEEIFKDFGNRDDIQFTGYVDELKLRKLYSGASGFVHTSFAEGFCMPVLEAMHYNLPVLCSFNTGAEEISKPGSIVINPYSEKSLLSGLNKLYEVITSGEIVNYDIKFSPSLMNKQLNDILDILKSKIKNKNFVYIPLSKSKEEAVEKTLLYAGLFNSGIRKDNLLKTVFDIKVTKGELESILLKLQLENKIYFKNDSVFLNYNYPILKSKSNGRAENKKLALKILNYIPFISSVSLSGGTTHYGVDEHDDIDLFIITKPNALYIVYSLIHIFSLIFKVRKELCANYLIDERSMEIKYPQDFYTAHQIISLKPLKNSHRLYTFFSLNRWITNFFPNFLWDSVKAKNSSENIFLIPINKLLKLFYRTLYNKLLKENINETSVILDEYTIKLHTNDNRLKITEEFFSAWNEYKSMNFIFYEPDNDNKRIVV